MATRNPTRNPAVLAPPDEAELVATAQAGDEDTFAPLAAAYRGPLHAHCYRMLGSLQDAEDALQETVVAAWRGVGGFEGRSSLRSWRSDEFARRRVSPGMTGHWFRRHDEYPDQ